MEEHGDDNDGFDFDEIYDELDEADQLTDEEEEYYDGFDEFGGVPPFIEYIFQASEHKSLKTDRDLRADLFHKLSERSSIPDPFKCVFYDPPLQAWIAATEMVVWDHVSNVWNWGYDESEENRIYGNTQKVENVRLGVINAEGVPTPNRIIFNDGLTTPSPSREWWKETGLLELRMVPHG